jgi:hypothetical protein
LYALLLPAWGGILFSFEPANPHQVRTTIPRQPFILQQPSLASPQNNPPSFTLLVFFTGFLIQFLTNSLSIPRLRGYVFDWIHEDDMDETEWSPDAVAAWPKAYMELPTRICENDRITKIVHFLLEKYHDNDLNKVSFPHEEACAKYFEDSVFTAMRIRLKYFKSTTHTSQPALDLPSTI